MRHTRYVCAAATLTAAVALNGQAKAESIDVNDGGLTVAATWRAQPSAIATGETTTFKLSLKATGGDGTSGISFGQSTFAFASGSGASAPTTTELVLGATASSAGDTLTALLAPLQVTYYEAGLHTATIATNDAAISWSQDGAVRSGTYSLNLGTTVAVGGGEPTFQSAKVPVLIDAGESFSFAALADAGVSGGALSYLWDFDSDGTFDSSNQNPDYAYASAGAYTGTLRILSDAGSTDFKYAVDVMSSPVAPVPLPAAVWGGIGLLSAFGFTRARAMFAAREMND